MSRFLGAGIGIDFLQAARRGLHEPKTDAVATVLQLLPSLRLPLPSAPLGDGDVEDVPICLAHKAQGQAADDDFIVRMRRKDQDLGSVRRSRRPRQ